MRTIVSRIEHAAKGDGQVTFVTGPEPVTKSWAQVHEEAKAVAAGLQARGINPAQHVAILGPTTASLVTCLQAVWLTGATPVVLPLPMRLGSLEEFTAVTKARIHAADCVALLIDPDFAPFVEPSADDPPIYSLAELERDAAIAGPDAFIRPHYHEEDLVVLQFTSGSTSEPKGVMLPNSVMAANLDAILEAAQVDVDRDVMVSWLPLYHDMGLVGFCILPMSSGIDLVLGAPQDFLAAPARWMEWIATYGGTATAGPNFSYVLATRALRSAQETLDLSSLRIALNGAEPVDPASVRAFVEAGARHGLRPGAVFPAFGMAEVAIAGSFPVPMSGLSTDIVDSVALEVDHQAVPVPAHHPSAREIVKLGKPVPGLRFRIVDPGTGAEMAEREVGELQISGTSVMSGYYHRSDADAESLVDGWLRTGDLAYLVDGEMVMCGRIKDLIIVGGRNVYPQDVERTVGAIDGVRAGNVIAFGIPGRAGKERLIVAAEARADDLDRLRAEVGRQTVAAIGIPCHEVVLVPPGSLPKTSSGKLQRADCRQQYEAGRLQRL
jgi:fatty-acyl-CoA synthase